MLHRLWFYLVLTIVMALSFGIGGLAIWGLHVVAYGWIGLEKGLFVWVVQLIAFLVTSKVASQLLSHVVQQSGIVRK